MEQLITIFKTLLTRISFLLVRHPQVLEKLNAEVNAVIAKGVVITRNELRGMNFLQNVLKESKTDPKLLL